MDKIKIKDLEVYANHGVFPEEKKLGQKFLVSVDLLTNTRAAGLSGNLKKSIHYGEVCHIIGEYLKENTFDLIESAAEHLAEHLLLSVANLQGVKLEIKKPWAPIGLPLETVSVEITRQWNEACVAIGSNLGDKAAYLQLGIAWLREQVRIKELRQSQFLETKPYGYLEQDDFLNGCLVFKTLYSPEELLDVLLEGERKAERVREIHWGPRTLDMDLIFYENLVLSTERLVLPHPEMQKRLFVLKPLAEIAPYKVHPLSGKRVVELLEELEKSEKGSE